MPRQALLKRLDPTGELSVPTLCTQLQPLVRQYERLVIQDRVDADTNPREALKVYNYFHQLNRAPDWGEIPLSCTCRVCFGNCVCKHTLLFVSLFKPELRVPNSWIAATPFLRKKCKSIKRTAGRRRLRLIEERQCDEKSINSKVSFLKGSASPPLPIRGLDPSSAAQLRFPSPILPSTTSSESDDDDFQIEVRMTAYTIQCLFIVTSWSLRRPNPAPGGRGTPAGPRSSGPRSLSVSQPLPLLHVLNLSRGVGQVSHQQFFPLRNGENQARNRW